MIYLLRHAERMDQSKNQTEKDIWVKSSRYKTNPYDSPLSLDGITHIFTNIDKILKNYKKDNQFSIDYIYCSPLTRCVQTALQVQRYIFEKFKQFILIRIEYGLSVHLFKENEIFCSVTTSASGLKLVKNKFILTKKFNFIDDYLNKDKIFKRHNSKRFDVQYKSIYSQEQINDEKTYLESINTRIDTLDKIAKLNNASNLTIIIAHCETCHLAYNFTHSKWFSPKEKTIPKYGYLKGIKLGVSKSTFKLSYLDVI